MITDLVLKLVCVLCDRGSNTWTLEEIYSEYEQQHSNTYLDATIRNASIRSQLQHHCDTAVQFREDTCSPIFENPEKGVWRLTPSYESYL